MNHSNLQHLFKKIQTFLGNICPTQEYASIFKTKFLNLNYPHIYSIHLLEVFTFFQDCVCYEILIFSQDQRTKLFKFSFFFCMYVIEIDCRFQVPTLPHVLNYFFYSIWPPVSVFFSFFDRELYAQGLTNHFSLSFFLSSFSTFSRLQCHKLMVNFKTNFLVIFSFLSKPCFEIK